MPAYDKGFADAKAGKSITGRYPGNEAEQAAYDRGALDGRPQPTAKPSAPKAAPKSPEAGVLDMLREAFKAEAPKAPKPVLHVDKGLLSEPIKSAVTDYLAKYGARLDDARKAKGVETITKIMSEKFDTGEAIAKQIPGFDVDTFTSAYVKTRSFAGGEQLKEAMKAQYPKYASVFDKHMSDKAFSTIYTHKSSYKDGTRKKR
jgi:hypothetical protein